MRTQYERKTTRKMDKVMDKVLMKDNQLLIGGWVATIGDSTYDLRFDYSVLLEGWQGQYREVIFNQIPVVPDEGVAAVPPRGWTTMRSVEFDPVTGLLHWIWANGDIWAKVSNKGVGSGRWTEHPVTKHYSMHR
jgi:hypothetical protein